MFENKTCIHILYEFYLGKCYTYDLEFILSNLFLFIYLSILTHFLSKSYFTLNL